MNAVQAPRSSIVELVERFRVCWEAWPEYLYVGQEKRQVGFALELCGTHEPGTEHPGPACPRCKPVFLALHAIANHVLPREERMSVYRVSSFDQALHHSPLRRNRPDVVLTVRIVHREGVHRPVDTCQFRCFEEMRRHLRDLGVPEGQWAARRGSSSMKDGSSRTTSPPSGASF